MQELKISSFEKIRLDEFLREKMPELLQTECSNSKIRRLIISAQVTVNGKVVTRPSFELRGKSEIKILFDKDKFFYEKKPDDIKFEVTNKSVLFENDDLIFIDKPAFFPVEQTITQNRDNLHDAVVRYLWKKNENLRNPPYVGIMHRLDRETSGVILFTKNRAANKSVQNMFENHDFEKKYFAVVLNERKFSQHSFEKKSLQIKENDEFCVEMYMERISSKCQAGKWGNVPENKGGKYSKTDFRVLKEIELPDLIGKKAFLIECNLFTGRTHQIRVHLASKGLPIVGDELYGGVPYKRMMLHSALLKGMDFCVKSDFDYLS